MWCSCSVQRAMLCRGATMDTPGYFLIYLTVSSLYQQGICQTQRTALQMRTTPSPAVVTQGSDVVFNCSIDLSVLPSDTGVIWRKYAGEVATKIAHDTFLEDAFLGIDRYIIKKRTENQRSDLILSIKNAKYEDSGTMQCEKSGSTLQARQVFIVCQDPGSESCQCMYERGWASPDCMQESTAERRSRESYESTITGLGVCLAIAVIFGIAMAVMLSRDCSRKIYKKRMLKLEQQRGNRPRDPYSESERLDIDPTEISETASQPESGVWSQNGQSEHGNGSGGRGAGVGVGGGAGALAGAGAVGGGGAGQIYRGASAPALPREGRQGASRYPPTHPPSTAPNETRSNNRHGNVRTTLQTHANQAFSPDEDVGAPPNYANVTRDQDPTRSSGVAKATDGVRPKAPPRSSHAYKQYTDKGQGDFADTKPLAEDMNASVTSTPQYPDPYQNRYQAPHTPEPEYEPVQPYPNHADLPAGRITTVSGNLTPCSVQSDRGAYTPPDGPYVPEARGAYTDVPKDKQGGDYGRQAQDQSRQRPAYSEPRKLDFLQTGAPSGDLPNGGDYGSGVYIDNHDTVI